MYIRLEHCNKLRYTFMIPASDLQVKLLMDCSILFIMNIFFVYFIIISILLLQFLQLLPFFSFYFFIRKFPTLRRRGKIKNFLKICNIKKDLFKILLQETL